MKLHWFSPLPPDRTDIGNFTLRLLPALAARADVTLWTRTETPHLPGTSIGGPTGVDLRRFDPARPDLRALNDGCAVYNLGNNGPFHADILDVLEMRPGVAILHEADLQGLLAYRWVERDHDPGPYVAAVERAHGPLGGWFARARVQGLPMDRHAHAFPLVDEALRRTSGIVCHTPATRAVAARLGLPACETPLPYPAAPAMTRPPRHGPLRLLQFGYLGPHRKLDAILAALAALPDGPPVRLDVHGTLWDEAWVRGQVAALGLEARVHLGGFLPDAALDAAIRDADLVLNMRWPMVGEASGTQLRVWSNAAPAMVTDHGWFAGLPDDAVLKAPPGEEAARVGAAVAALRRDRRCFDAVGANGRRWLAAHHAPEDYVEAVLEFVRRMHER